MSETIVAYQSFIGVDLHKNTVTLQITVANRAPRFRETNVALGRRLLRFLKEVA
jgi:hypothetical protein